MANIAYKWNTGSPSINVNVSNMASDNSGVTKLELVNVSGGVTFSYSSGSSSAPGQPSYTSTFLVSASSLPNGYAMSTFTTKVNWKSGGSTPNGTKQTAYLCQPATSMTLSTNNATVWSTYTAAIPVTRKFVGASGNLDVWAKDSGKVTFSSNDTNFVTVGTSTATTSTTAQLANLTSKVINGSKTITISGTSTAGAPNDSKSNAAPSALNGTANITIRNSTSAIGVTLDDNHLYRGENTYARVTSTPHANGIGSIVYSNALTSIGATKDGVVMVPTSLAANSSTDNTNVFPVSGKGPGVVTINIGANAQTVGNNVNASVNVTCSSLERTQTKYTYTGGTGAFDISYDSITSNSASAYATASTTASNSSAGKFTYNGVKSGSTTISMASGAQVVTCSNLNNTQTTYTYTGGKGTMSISYDKVNLISAPDSVIRATLDGSISQTTANVTATYTGKGSGTTTFDMASGAKILITCSSLSKTQTIYTYSGGQGQYPVYNDAISGTSSWATLSNNSLAYNGFTGGQTGTVSMRSGATVSVVCSNLPATTQRVVYSKTDSATSTKVDFSNDEVSGNTDTTDLSYSATSTSVTVTANKGITETKTLTLNMRSGAKIVVTCYPASADDTQVELNVGDRKVVNIGANDSILSTKGTHFSASQNGSELTIIARSIGIGGEIKLASGIVIKVIVTDITVDIS